VKVGRASEPEFVANWNATYAYPKFILSSFPDYFRYIERKYGSQLATASGDGGPYWEDGTGSDAKNTAIDRNNQTRAVSAEGSCNFYLIEIPPGRDAKPKARVSLFSIVMAWVLTHHVFTLEGYKSR
jgi:hypothetical protein